ncbi:MAG: hypothetical protein WCW47_02085 [Candidatus Paceibacterota bacterium]|jgi:hypothetical protein
MSDFLGLLQTVFKATLVGLGTLFVVGVIVFAIWCAYGVIKSRRVVTKSFIALVMAVGLLGFGSVAYAADAKEPYYGYERCVINGVVWTVPDYINIQRFPPLGGKMSSRDAKLLQVHREPLVEAGWYVNEIRSRHTFEVVWLEKGQMVWASNGGHEARYLDGCINRISLLLANKITVVLQPNPAPPTTTPAPSATSPTAPMGIGEMTVRVITYPFRAMWSFWTNPWRGWTAPVQ